jgi:ATP-dependent DNA ligase
MKAMLAHKFDDSRVDWSSDKVFIQPKLDGVRCLIKRVSDFPGQEHLASYSVKAYSRNGKEFKNVRHITNALDGFFFHNPDVVLDGELYNHKLKNDFEKIISLVRKQKPTDTDRRDAQHLVQFHCYDYIDDKYDSYDTRRDQLICSNIYDAQIKYVHAQPVKSYEQARDFHATYLSEGYEGSIIRLDGVYKHGRSYDLMKFKDFSDTEATIVGYEIGKGKRSGTLGKFLMLDDEGVRFGCPPGKGYTYKDLADMLANIDFYIGKRATFTYFQRTQAGSYRHPLFKAIRNYE